MTEWSPGMEPTPIVRLPASYEGRGPIMRGEDDPEPEEAVEGARDRVR